jgi:hypothetical protein
LHNHVGSGMGRQSAGGHCDADHEQKKSAREQFRDHCTARE